MRGIGSGLIVFVLLMPLSVMASGTGPAPKGNLKEMPRVWLDKMSRSQRELDYQGAFTYEQAGSIRAMQISHAVINGEEFERLEHLDGKEYSVVRRGHGPECVHSGDKLLRLFEKQSSSRNSVDHFYDFSVAGRDRVAGRSVIELAVMPRDKHRFGHRLSVDEETGLLLRSVRYGTNNQVLERFQFVTLALGGELAGSLFDESLQSAGQSAMTHHVRHLAPEGLNAKVHQNKRSWQLAWLPGGFHSASRSQSPSALDMMTYTDGLTAFSVFMEVHQLDDPSSGVQGRAQRGATMAYSRAVLLNGATYRVTVVGEIPHHTAERIAASVTPAG